MRFRQGLMGYKFRRIHAHIHSIFQRERGQSTVEFVLVFVAFLSLVVACGALWHLGESGKLIEHASVSASHHITISELGGWGDVFSY